MIMTVMYYLWIHYSALMGAWAESFLCSVRHRESIGIASRNFGGR